MGAMASQITRLAIVYSTVYSGANQRKHQGSASLAFVRGIHRWPVNSLHKWPVARKMFPSDDVIIMHPHHIGVKLRPVFHKITSLSTHQQLLIILSKNIHENYSKFVKIYLRVFQRWYYVSIYSVAQLSPRTCIAKVCWAELLSCSNPTRICHHSLMACHPLDMRFDACGSLASRLVTTGDRRHIFFAVSCMAPILRQSQKRFIINNISLNDDILSFSIVSVFCSKPPSKI